MAIVINNVQNYRHLQSMKLVKSILLIFAVICYTACNISRHQPWKADIEGCWRSGRDSLKFGNNNRYRYTGHGVKGQIQFSEGYWRAIDNTFILTGDSTVKDSLELINKKTLAEANEKIRTAIQGKNVSLPRSVLYSSLSMPYLIYIHFNNDRFKIEDDTSLIQLDESGSIVNRYTKCNDPAR